MNAHNARSFRLVGGNGKPPFAGRWMLAATGFDSNWYWLLGLTVLVVSIWSLLIFLDYRKLRKAGPAGATDRLFTALCDDHGLSMADRALLLQLARDWKVKSANHLFVDHAGWSTHPSTTQGSSLFSKLFGEEMTLAVR